MYASLASAPQELVLEMELVLTAAAPEPVLCWCSWLRVCYQGPRRPKKSRRALLVRKNTTKAFLCCQGDQARVASLLSPGRSCGEKLVLLMAGNSVSKHGRSQSQIADHFEITQSLASNNRSPRFYLGKRPAPKLTQYSSTVGVSI